MHFEFLVEDRSGAALLEHLLPRIFGESSVVTYRVHPFRGIGRLPKDLKPSSDPEQRILLDQLPRHLAGYGRTPGIDAVVVVVDLDKRSHREMMGKLSIAAKEKAAEHLAVFCFAIEEVEAWLLGDTDAILAAYPKANLSILRSYQQDSICGTWELLADALVKGGAKSLANLPYSSIGKLKCEWAERIAPRMRVDRNASPSFSSFRAQILRRLS